MVIAGAGAWGLYKLHAASEINRAEAVMRGYGDQKLAHELLEKWGRKAEARRYFLNAAENYRIAGASQEENNARSQAQAIIDFTPDVTPSPRVFDPDAYLAEKKDVRRALPVVSPVPNRAPSP
jgi:hypothetical protein